MNLSAAPAARTPSSAVRIPNLLTIAGVDPSGGAGVLADVKTFSALGTWGCAVICALTAQNTRAVTGIQGIAPDFIRLQIDTLFDDVKIDSAKIGMLGTAAIARSVADALHARPAAQAMPLVLDPVMVSKGGDVLLPRDAIQMLTEAVMPLATIITPNLAEAALLLSQSRPETVADMRRMAERLRRLLPDHGERWVLLKGGHLQGDLVDLLFDGDRMIERRGERIDTRNLHGTGCTLSAAVAALLPQRPDVPSAVADALDYLEGALRASSQLDVGRREGGQGHGPVHHFHRLWKG
ncbi:MAG: bifunctional hydroxymethylpyrimidine kinase/phosphomethylpyrimidine kinase [Lautropia sp.]|nr:bifunctional hydroxymethylpyrimidine kinase/phosphomethylpyrimidine kinase [Lautropia sp.]